MDSDLARVCRLFSTCRAAGTPLVLATIVRTAGSTYRKTGARALIDPNGASSGILSGGCLEADLREHAAQVLRDDRPARIVFDTRVSDDPIWGLGLGCEGLMEVWLQPARPENEYAPLPYLQRCWDQEEHGLLATVIGGEVLPGELGAHGCAGMTTLDPLSTRLGALSVTSPGTMKVEFAGRILEVFAARVTLPPALLICGAGPDAIPVASFAVCLGWRVTVYDHRPAYALAENFPGAARVILGRPEELTERIDLSRLGAAVIMSHHLPSDVAYLRCLARKPPGYVAALGPAARRERLLADAGTETAAIMRERLYGPAGLAIGAQSPESIALAIVAQIHAVRSAGGGAELSA